MSKYKLLKSSKPVQPVIPGSCGIIRGNPSIIREFRLFHVNRKFLLANKTEVVVPILESYNKIQRCFMSNTGPCTRISLGTRSEHS